MSLIERHREINLLLDDELKRKGVHALSITVCIYIIEQKPEKHNSLFKYHHYYYYYDYDRV